MHAPRQETWKDTFKRSPYFIGSIIIHLLLFLLIGGVVVFEAVFPTKEFESASYIIGGGDPGPAAPPSQADSTPAESSSVPAQAQLQAPSSTSAATSELLSVDSSDSSSFTVPVSTQISQTIDTSAIKNVTQELAKNSDAAVAKSFGARSASIRGTVSQWGSGGGGSGGGGPSGTGRNVQAEFVLKVAKLEGLNVKGILFDSNGNERGPLKNLTRMINSWSQGKIKSKVDSRPLDMSSPTLLEKAPPFVYMTGAQDFKLTASEVENIRNYLMAGGCIWGDSGLAGLGSRFDIAFRREMKRVIPDADKQFEVIPLSHPIFGGEKSFFQLKAIPDGMNYRQDSFEVLKIDNEIAVLYTPNNYTDMMRVAYKEPVKPTNNEVELQEGRINGKEIEYITPGGMWRARETYFRNFSVEGSEEVFQVSVNIIIHLLTRFQERLLSGN